MSYREEFEECGNEMNGNCLFRAILKRFRGKDYGVSVEKVKRGQYNENFLEF